MGQTVFAHKGGVHVSAVRRNPATYEHIPPETVGNVRRVLVSELSGQSNIQSKLEELGIDLAATSEDVKQIVQQIKELEADGYQFEAAEASFELLVKKAKGQYTPFFELKDFKVITYGKSPYAPCPAEAIIRLNVKARSTMWSRMAMGRSTRWIGPYVRLFLAHIPSSRKRYLTDFKVRSDQRSGGDRCKGPRAH